MGIGGFFLPLGAYPQRVVLMVSGAFVIARPSALRGSGTSFSVDKL